VLLGGCIVSGPKPTPAVTDTKIYDSLARRDGGEIDLTPKERQGDFVFLMAFCYLPSGWVWKQGEGSYHASLEDFKLLIPGQEPIGARAVGWGTTMGYVDQRTFTSQDGRETSFSVAFAIPRAEASRTDLRLQCGDQTLPVPKARP
jgi:hypothetical protein